MVSSFKLDNISFFKMEELFRILLFLNALLLLSLQEETEELSLSHLKYSYKKYLYYYVEGHLYAIIYQPIRFLLYYK